MRLALSCLCATLALVAAAAALARDTTPSSSVTSRDTIGDSGSGPDISALAVSVQDASLTLAVTFANRTLLDDGESVQFFLTAPAGGELDVATFGGGETVLAVWQNGAWQRVHGVNGTWSDGTFTITQPLSDLRDSVHQPVVPTLKVQAYSYASSGDGGAMTAVDAAPNTGTVPVRTQGGGPTTTVPAPTTTAPATTTAPPAPPAPPTTTTKPRPAPPTLDQRIRRLSHGRLEWTRLRARSVPAGATTTIACTKGCKLLERLHAAHGIATSKRFLRVPLGSGASVLVLIVRGNGTGYWFRTSFVGRPKPKIHTAHGCIGRGRKLLPRTAC